MVTFWGALVRVDGQSPGLGPRGLFICGTSLAPPPDTLSCILNHPAPPEETGQNLVFKVVSSPYTFSSFVWFLHLIAVFLFYLGPSLEPSLLSLTVGGLGGRGNCFSKNGKVMQVAGWLFLFLSLSFLAVPALA